MKLQAGELVGERYELREQLGAGGIATVYLAHDSVLARDVALKVLRDNYSGDDTFVERFLREALSAARLNHPNIVQVFDRGDDDGTYYIAMEYVEGPTLKETIKGGPLTQERIVDYARQALEALGCAHRNGIVHRDVKPQNMLIDRDLRLKVTDFGIARAATDNTITQVGTIAGTAHYLSPEQARGERVTAASDIYSLGVVMYEMATRFVPFGGETMLDVAFKHVNEPAPAASELRPDLSPQLEAIIARCLAKDPAERYQSAEAVLEELDAAQQTVVLSSAPGGAQAAGLSIGTVDNDQDTVVVGEPVRDAAAGGAAAVAASSVLQRARSSSQNLWHRLSATLRGWPVRTRVAAAAALLGTVLLALVVISLANSSGSDTGQGKVDVPDVTELTRREARSELEARGLKLGAVRRQTSQAPKGTVLAQSPDAGARRSRGEAVSVTVSSGPAGVQVPRLVELRLADAQALAQQSRLRLEVRSITGDEPKPEWLVVAQDPASGVSLPPQSAVAITVAEPADKDDERGEGKGKGKDKKEKEKDEFEEGDD